MEELHSYATQAEEAYDEFLTEMSKLINISSSHPALDIDQERCYNRKPLNIDPKTAEKKISEQLEEADKARINANNELYKLDEELVRYQNNLGPNDEVSIEYDHLNKTKRRIREDKKKMAEDLAEIKIEIHEELEEQDSNTEESIVSKLQDATY